MFRVSSYAAARAKTLVRWCGIQHPPHLKAAPPPFYILPFLSHVLQIATMSSKSLAFVTMLPIAVSLPAVSSSPLTNPLFVACWQRFHFRLLLGRSAYRRLRRGPRLICLPQIPHTLWLGACGIREHGWVRRCGRPSYHFMGSRSTGLLCYRSRRRSLAPIL